MIEERYNNVYGLRPAGLAAVLFFATAVLTFAQADKKFIRKGNHEYEKEKFSDSEILYRKALDKNKESADALFNTGDALYKQKKYEEAGRQFDQNYSMNDEKKKRSASLYNMGNSLLMANKVKESIDAYKGSLKLDPKNMETKYNLAYAQDLLKQQQQQQQQKDQNKNKQDKDQDKQKQNKDQKNKQDNKDQSQDMKDQQQKQQQQQQQDQGISKEDAQRVLDALANDEKNVQEKVKLAKAAKEKVRTIKNW
ncbi:MAG: tetratricopeptide repeat protein [Bacteroidales bacterium]